MSRGAKVVVAVVLVLASLWFGFVVYAGQQQHEANVAVEAFVPPASFVVRAESATVGLNEIVREIEYTSSASVEEACLFSEQALTDWAGEPVEVEFGTDRGPACSLRISPVESFPALASAGITVHRTGSSAGEWDAEPGGIRSVRFWVVDLTRLDISEPLDRREDLREFYLVYRIGVGEGLHGNLVVG